MKHESINIREERPGDINAIREVETQAFGRSAEADLVDSLRESGAAILSLVAIINGELVGHILFSPGAIEDGNTVTAAIALAPVAVLPAHQNKGVGSALIRRGMATCRDLGHSVMFLLGHSAYYPRFGFVRGSAKGIADEYGAGDAFMVAELVPDALAGIRGTARFHPEFQGV